MFSFNIDGVRRYRNTNATGNNLTFCVTLHDTNIVEGVKFGSELTEITLDSGGWDTHTTKKRMNETAEELGLNYKVYAKKGQWYVDCLFPGKGTVTYTFSDGMTIPVYNKGR